MSRGVGLLLCLTAIVFSQAQNIYTFAGNGIQGFSGDGSAATLAQLSNPTRVAVDASNNVYFGESSNNRVRMVNSLGIISTVAGNGIAGYSGDGGLATLAQIKNPQGVAIDGSGNIYIAEPQNHRIRKVNSAGIISTYAGTGSSGFSGDGGTAALAQINSPYGIAVDASGNLYIGDAGNHRVRMVNTSGIISTFAGNGVLGFNGDGGAATLAQLKGPSGIAIDAFGNVYIADEGNHRIRKVNSSGIISTVAGTTVSGYSGDGGMAIQAKLNYPEGVAVDAAGNLYIADLGNYVIRKVNVSGIISTYAGTGVSGYSGDGGPANTCQFKNPNGVATDANGNLYITDMLNHRVRRICNGNCSASSVLFFENEQNQITIYPNPSSSTFYLTNLTMDSKIDITDITGKLILSDKTSDSYTVDLRIFNKGVYFYTIKMGISEYHGKLILN